MTDMADARLGAFRTAWSLLEQAKDLYQEFRKAHPTPETAPVPSDYFAFVAMAQAYATLANTGADVGLVSGTYMRAEDQRTAEHEALQRRMMSANDLAKAPRPKKKPKASDDDEDDDELTERDYDQ